jgi:predicted DCC family thiol-disulfide oxidoreductase YuxK
MACCLFWGDRPLARSAAEWPKDVAPDAAVVIFDGVCNFCNGSVQFALRREREPKLRFAAAQSVVGSALLACFGRDVSQLDSILLVEDGRAYERSDAILRIVGYLRWTWQWLQLGWLLPRAARDVLYNFIAKRRYQWFGKREECMIPTKEVRARFFA